MKNRITIALLFILTGLLIALAPTVLFKVCSTEKMKMACYYTRGAEIGLGILIAALGAVYFFFENKGTRIGISIAQFLNAVLVLAYPLKLIGLCKNSEMDCRVKTLPALIVLAVILGGAAAANVIYLAKFGKTE